MPVRKMPVYRERKREAYISAVGIESLAGSFSTDYAGYRYVDAVPLSIEQKRGSAASGLRMEYTSPANAKTNSRA
ncbi:hypothetical protein [Neptunomonas qingdaonensis]|nr:hypothetical protein [Neptunomonas qingdaonensis]